MIYRERTYRQTYKQEDLTFFQVLVEETDLYIGIQKQKFTSKIINIVENKVKEQRLYLKQYINRDPNFLTALVPHKLLPGAPVIAKHMANASLQAGTGPMSAVAGAFSEIVADMLINYSEDVVVENGGDIFLKTTKARQIGIFAGTSPFSNKIALKIFPEQSPLAVCTSSGTVGHSLSFGSADAAVVLSPSGTLADAVATAAANLVHGYEDLQSAVEFCMNIKNIKGALVIKDDRIAAAGDIILEPIT